MKDTKAPSKKMVAPGAPPGFSFLPDCVRVPIERLTALKVMRPEVKSSAKYLTILATVREVGLVEPPAVTPDPQHPGRFLLLDGHLRIEALKDIGIDHVDCLVATDDDTYSYNKRINRLSAVQDHKMIMQAMEKGVSAERLAKALGLSPATIRQRFRLLNGICDEVIALLGDTACPAAVFNILRQMKPLRQIQVAEMMLSGKNFSVMFADGMLLITPANQLAFAPKPDAVDAVSTVSIARLERELASLQLQSKGVEDSYGPDVLHLTVIKGFVAKLLGNVKIVRWLAQQQPDYLKEFQKLTELVELPSGVH